MKRIEIPGYEAVGDNKMYRGVTPNIRAGKPVVPILILGKLRFPSLTEVLDEMAQAAVRFRDNPFPPVSYSSDLKIEDLMSNLPEQIREDIINRRTEFVDWAKLRFDPLKPEQLERSVPALTLDYSLLHGNTWKRLSRENDEARRMNKILDACRDKYSIKQGLGKRWDALLELGDDNSLPRDYRILGGSYAIEDGLVPLQGKDLNEVRKFVDGIYDSINTKDSLEKLEDISGQFIAIGAFELTAEALGNLNCVDNVDITWEPKKSEINPLDN